METFVSTIPPSSITDALTVQARDDPALLASGFVSPVDSLCDWCEDDAEQPATTALTRRSGKICKSILRLKKFAQKGCWMCQSLLAAIELWAKIDKLEFERLVQVWIRQDKERFTISGPAILPKIQLFCPIGQLATHE